MSTLIRNSRQPLIKERCFLWNWLQKALLSKEMRPRFLIKALTQWKWNNRVAGFSFADAGVEMKFALSERLLGWNGAFKNRETSIAKQSVYLIYGKILFLRASRFQFNLNQKSLGKANNFRTPFHRNSHHENFVCTTSSTKCPGFWMLFTKALVSVSFNLETEWFLLKFSLVIFLFIFHLTEKMTKAECKFLQFGEKVIKSLSEMRFAWCSWESSQFAYQKMFSANNLVEQSCSLCIKMFCTRCFV